MGPAEFELRIILPSFLPLRKIPFLDSTPTHRHHTSMYLRGLDSLYSCLDAMFQSKIIEARKYVPSVIQALKSGILADELVPALVDRFFEYGVLLSSEQFDLVVKLLNSALVDQQSAMMLLPLTTVIYRVGSNSINSMVGSINSMVLYIGWVLLIA